jgi:hypothetical protein
MRTARTVLFLFLATAAAAETFNLGSRETGPNAASLVRAVSVRNGALALWSRLDQKGEFLVRIAADGRRIGESTPLMSGGIACRNGLLASDGTDALLVCTGTVLMAAHVTEEGIGELHPIAVAGHVRALEWNGRRYVVVVAGERSTLSAMLLDRDGLPASGAVAIQNAGYYSFSLACGDTRCLIALENGRDVHGAVLGETSFPSAGQHAPPFLAMRLFKGNRVAVGFDDLGFYSITNLSSDGLTLRRHGFLRGNDPGRVLRSHGQLETTLPGEPIERNPEDARTQPDNMEELAIPTHVPPLTGIPSLNGSDLWTAAHAREIYIGYPAGDSHRTVLLRVTDGAVTEVHATDGVSRNVAGVAAGASGSIAFWRTNSDSPVYATAIESDRYTSGVELVSSAPGIAMMPRLARGSNTLLAAWLEQRAGDRDSLFVSILDLDGRPLTAPLRIATGDPHIAGAEIAFDGANFFVVWNDERGDRTQGRLISPDGQPLGETIDIPIYTPYVLTLVWSGREYLMSGDDNHHGGLWRVSASGVLLGAVNSWFGCAAAVLVPNGSGGLTGLAWTYSPADFATGPQLFATYQWVSLVDRDLVPSFVPFSSPLSRDNTFAFIGATPAVALGEGDDEFAVIDVTGFEIGLRLLGVRDLLPYPAPVADRKARLYAFWLGNQYLVGAGKTLARHARNRALLGTTSLGDDVLDAAVAPGGPNAVLVLRQRGWRRMEALRVVLPGP